MTWIITSDQVNPPGDAAITYDITNAGGVFNLRSTGTVDYEAEWGDGNVEISTLNTLPHTYTAGDYDLVVYSDGVYRPYFNNVTADATQITSVAIGSGADLGTNLTNAWYGASNMTTFTCPFDVTSSVTSFSQTWRACSGLTSFPLLDTSSGTSFNRTWDNCTSLTSFPLVNTSSGTNFGSAWYNCNSLTSFPLLDTSSGTSFNQAWLNCGNLASFPLVNTSSGTNFINAWRACSGLTSFPLLDTSSGTSFSQAWLGCSSLSTFPANMFDTTGTLVSSAFSDAWLGCALTAQSIENILVSLDTNGATGVTLGINGGTNADTSTWSAAANAAWLSLDAKGWAITQNGPDPT
jgi:hypothetical protein